MEKNYKSMACPKCSSSDVNVESHISEPIKELKEYEGIEVKTIKRERIYSCKCNNCNNEYEMNYDFEKYRLFGKPYLPFSNIGDMDLIASYETKDPSYHNYKLISLSTTPYDKNYKDEETYLLIIDAEKYPIKISKESVDIIVNEINDLYESNIETKKDKELTINTYLGRNK